MSDKHPHGTSLDQDGQARVQVRVTTEAGQLLFGRELPVLARVTVPGQVQITLGERTGDRVRLVFPTDVLVDVPDAEESPERLRERAEAAFYARVAVP